MYEFAWRLQGMKDEPVPVVSAVIRSGGAVLIVRSMSHAVHCTLSLRSYAYDSEIISGDVTLKEHEEARWVTPARLGAYDFADHHHYVAEVLMDRIQGGTAVAPGQQPGISALTRRT